MRITGETKVTGIIGYPLTYTLSPVMHNRAFDVLGINYRYLPFVVEEANLAAAINGIKALNIRGVNVTMPHKERVMDVLDEVTPEAEAIGAVNTILNEGGRLIGYNTDGMGFIQSLREASFEPAGKTAILLGVGGGAKAVAVALAQAGAKSIAIVSRSIDKAEGLKARLQAVIKDVDIKTLTYNDNLADIFQVGDLVVNATPVGMKESGDLLPVPLELIRAQHVVYDLIYTPPMTALLKGAQDKGARAVNGLGMLLHQAAAAFEIWTGFSAPTEEMRRALLEELESGERPGNVSKENR